ncbi:DHHW family protein [Desulfogranum japonicum]|uniref:DHHW family protein n=1 Tax=Desulfogranum japonicum TaxID=231447 RepID=UPI0003FD908E|nr:DHHW family protein [Desulfogranum japonicum]
MHCPKPLHLIFISTFFVALWIPVSLLLISGGKEISIHEKRKLASLPSLKETGVSGYPKQFEKYFNDQFGLREPLLKTHALYQFALFNVSSSEKVIVGKNGWLFQNGQPHFKDMRNQWPFSEAELRHWANVLIEKQRWLQQRNVQYMFVITPSKHIVYGENLPDAFQPVSPESRADQLTTYLQRHTNVTVVDMRKALQQAKKNGQIYHKTDTHWNSLGAYYGYRALLQEINRVLPQVQPIHLSVQDFIAVQEEGGDLAESLNLGDSLRETAFIPQNWQSECFNRAINEQNLPTSAARNRAWFTTTCTGKPYSVLMFRDSYSLALMPYLTETFGTVTYIPHSPVRRVNMQELTLKHNPELVIEQRTTRWLRTPEG